MLVGSRPNAQDLNEVEGWVLLLGFNPPVRFFNDNVSQSSIGGFIQPIRLGETGYVEIVDQNGILSGILVGFSVLLGLNQALVKVVNDGFSPVFQSGFRSVRQAESSSTTISSIEGNTPTLTAFCR